MARRIPSERLSLTINVRSSRCRADTRPAEAHRGSWSGARKAAGASRKTGCAHHPYRDREREAGAPPPAAVLRGEMSVSRKRFGDLGFDRLGKQGMRAIAQDLGERIGDLTRLAQGDDFIVFHGVSILIWMCGRLPPPLIRRLPFPTPSTTLLHSFRSVRRQDATRECSVCRGGGNRACGDRSTRRDARTRIGRRRDDSARCSSRPCRLSEIFEINWLISSDPNCPIP